MTHQESNLIFDEVDTLLKQVGFTPKEGYDKRYLFKNDYMAFNCPHMCNSLRMFQIPERGTRKLVIDERTSFVRTLEENRAVASNFITKVILKINGQDNPISGGLQVVV